MCHDAVIVNDDVRGISSPASSQCCVDDPETLFDIVDDKLGVSRVKSLLPNVC